MMSGSTLLAIGGSAIDADTASVESVQRLLAQSARPITIDVLPPDAPDDGLTSGPASPERASASSGGATNGGEASDARSEQAATSSSGRARRRGFISQRIAKIRGRAAAGAKQAPPKAAAMEETTEAPSALVAAAAREVGAGGRSARAARRSAIPAELELSIYSRVLVSRYATSDCSAHT